MNESYLNESSEIPLHSYHRYQTLINYMNDYITHLSLIIVDLKDIVYGLINVKPQPSTLPFRCHNEECEVQYMLGVCRQNMDDLVRVNSILKGYQKGKSFLQKILPMEISEYNPQTGIYLSKIEAKVNENKPEQNKVGFLTFRQIQEEKSSQEKIQTKDQPTQPSPQSPTDLEQKSDLSKLCSRNLVLINLIKEELNTTQQTND